MLAPAGGATHPAAIAVPLQNALPESTEVHRVMPAKGIAGITVAVGTDLLSSASRWSGRCIFHGDQDVSTENNAHAYRCRVMPVVRTSSTASSIGACSFWGLVSTFHALASCMVSWKCALAQPLQWPWRGYASSLPGTEKRRSARSISDATWISNGRLLLCVPA